MPLREQDFLKHHTQNARHLMWFLGAGASRTSGLPTASDITWDLKRAYYCAQENQDVQSHDINNKAIRAKKFSAALLPPRRERSLSAITRRFSISRASMRTESERKKSALGSRPATAAPPCSAVYILPIDQVMGARNYCGSMSFCATSHS